MGQGEQRQGADQTLVPRSISRGPPAALEPEDQDHLGAPVLAPALRLRGSLGTWCDAAEGHRASPRDVGLGLSMLSAGGRLPVHPVRHNEGSGRGAGGPAAPSGADGVCLSGELPEEHGPRGGREVDALAPCPGGKWPWHLLPLQPRDAGGSHPGPFPTSLPGLRFHTCKMGTMTVAPLSWGLSEGEVGPCLPSTKHHPAPPLDSCGWRLPLWTRGWQRHGGCALRSLVPGWWVHTRGSHG